MLRQHNQPSMNVVNCPKQELKPMIKQFLKRNRFEAMEGTHDEVEGLLEIDEYVSRAAAKGIDKQDRILLDVVRTGASWTKNCAFWSGQEPDYMCPLCG